MANYRVWFDPYYAKRSTEADGEEFEAISAESAARQFGEARYWVYQHVDPGMVLVRDLETKEVTRWRVASRVVIDVEEKAPPSDSPGGEK